MRTVQAVQLVGYLLLALLHPSSSIDTLSYGPLRTHTETAITFNADPRVVSRGSVALAFFGMFPRGHNHECSDNFTSVKTVSLPNIWHTVVKPSLDDGFDVYVVGHTWSNSQCKEEIRTHEYNETLIKSAVEKNFRHPLVRIGQFVMEDEHFLPCRNNTSIFGVACSPNVIGPLMSMGRVLRLLPSDDQRVLLLRWDLEFLSRFSFSALAPDIFYRANWCRATGPVVTSQDGRACHELASFFECGCLTRKCETAPSDGRGLPDFWFAGSRGAMVAIFGNAAETLAGGKGGSGGCCCLHGVSQWLVETRSRRHGFKLGRYKHHHLDYDHLREENGHFTQERAAFVRGGRGLFLEVDVNGEALPPYNISLEQNHSVCDALHYCEWDEKRASDHLEFRPRRT